jgi:hypothetical protein
VDLEVLGDGNPEDADKEELKEVRAAFIKEHPKAENLEEVDEDSESEVESDEEDELEDDIADAIHQAEEKEESKGDSEEEIGYGLMDDEEVSSEEEKEELKSYEKRKSH